MYKSELASLKLWSQRTDYGLRAGTSGDDVAMDNVEEEMSELAADAYVSIEEVEMDEAVLAVDADGGHEEEEIQQEQRVEATAGIPYPKHDALERV